MSRAREHYVVCHFKHGWLVDSCAGGTYSHDDREAVWFKTPGEAQEAMTAAELGVLGVDYEIVPLTEVKIPG